MLTWGHSWLFLLLPLPLVVRWILPAYHEERAAVRLPFFQRLAQASGSKPGEGAVVRKRTHMQTVLYLLVWALTVTAIAKPQWLEPPIVRETPTRDLLLLVDLSGSMEAQDFTAKDGTRIDRLTAVKEVLDDFLSRREGDRVGLIVFGNAAFVQAPFTDDLDVCRQLLDETAVRMAGPRTALGDAIGLGITLFERSKVEQRVMIALTDGNDTGSKVPPAEAARIAAESNIVIHTVAIGNPEAVGEEKLDEEALRTVANQTGGRYFFGANREELEGIYVELDALETRKVETASYRPRRDLYHWPLGAALTLGLTYHLMMAIGRGLRTRPTAEGAA